MFISWTDMERRQMALEVATGQLAPELAEALLDGYLETASHSWVDSLETGDSTMTRYAAICRILGVPEVYLVRLSKSSLPPEAKGYSYGVGFQAPFELTETAREHLRQTVKKRKGLSGEWLGRELYLFPSEDQARSFLRELLHVLSSTVFRKAG
ncbi:hypothetical protein Tfer_2032 [Thermincola ferriacetica]|uniref:Uncharacterized protein n=1 Tax=Thermincola ferriacetica TaxID=281456 RepID=A0A0L6W1W9_9FIRM|nr:hypothetical protein [Thermincola ferriacetica]KNZ69393.1 hypothetical protein Tfer_2032 [Thermincola ferriacetica]